MNVGEFYNKSEYSKIDFGSNPTLFTKKELLDFANEYLEAITVTRCCTELPIYMTYDNSDSEVFAAFTDKERCELESKESGMPMQKTTLYFGKRK